MLVQNSSDVITVIDADGIIRYDSPAVETVLGYKPEERVASAPSPTANPTIRSGALLGLTIFSGDHTSTMRRREGEGTSWGAGSAAAREL